MINIGSSIFECETLFLQPTWSCQKNCSGCYVKEKESKFGSEEIELWLWVKLLTQLSWQKDIKSNQITLALDTLPNDITSNVYEKMYSIAHVYQALVRQNKKNIKYHLTVNTVSDLEHYCNSELFEGLDMISVSNINNLDDIKSIRECAPGAKINWNVLSETFNKKSPESIKQILTHVNQCYLLLSKAPLGQEGHDWKSFREVLLKLPDMFPTYDSIQENDSCAIPSLINKIIADGCWRDANKYRIESTGCSSNVSRFQIWPDGRITGCAYNSHMQYGKKAETFQDVLDNLFDARTRYEFNHCTIPNFGLTNIKQKSL